MHPPHGPRLTLRATQQTGGGSGAPSSRTLPATINEVTDDEEDDGGPSSSQSAAAGCDMQTKEWAEKMRRLTSSKDEEALDGD